MLHEEIREPALRELSRSDRDRFLARSALIIRRHGRLEPAPALLTALAVLMGMAAVMLVIACSNVAGLSRHEPPRGSRKWPCAWQSGPGAPR